MPVLDTKKLIANRTEAIAQAHIDAGIDKAELDISGGIDSAVMAGLLVKALGPENVILVHSGMSTNPEQTDRAQRLADALNCPMLNIDLSDIYGQLVSLAHASIIESRDTSASYDVLRRCAADKTILGSVRSTLRAPVGRMFNRMLGGGLRHGTGNECEDRWLRFFQKGGDGEVDSNPIAMLSKGEVYQLAFALGKDLGCEDVYRDTILATPSPDLWGTGDGHSDEAELLSRTGAPFTYSRIDADTGEYSSVGTIERVSRFLDEEVVVQSLLFEEILFDDDEPNWDDLVDAADVSTKFQGLTRNTIRRLLKAARKAEKITRHKMNPNCPTYGVRYEMLDAGILTDDLPKV